MYRIEKISRRITTYVIEEAYQWLYHEIDNDKYTISSDKEARKLILDIKTNQGLTKEYYDKFAAMVGGNPFINLIKPKRSSKKVGAISSSNLLNYFIQYNDVVLPLGFVIEFFEDDYETEKEKQAIIADFIKFESSVDFEVTCKSELEEKSRKIDKFETKHPSIFKTPASFWFNNGMRVVMTFVLLFFFISFLSATNMATITSKYIFDAKFNDDLFIGEEYADTSAFLISAGEEISLERVYGTRDITYAQYYAVYSFHLIFNIFILIVLLARLGTTINILRAFITIIVYRAKFSSQKKKIIDLEETGIVSIKEFIESNSETLANSGKLPTELQSSAPVAMRGYISVSNFAPGKYEDKINKLYQNKKMNKFFFMDVDDIPRMERLYWKKSSWITTIIFLVIPTAIIDMPTLFLAVVPAIGEMIENIFS